MRVSQFVLSIHQLTVIWGFFPIFLAIMNTVAINIPVQVFVVGIDFISLGPISRSGIAESYGNSMFNFLRTAKLFYSSCTILHPHQQCMTVPITPHPCQHLVLSVFFLTVIPLGVKWYLIVVLICMSLMANDIEYLFTCLLAICISSLEKCVFTLPILELLFFLWGFFL